MSGGRGTTHLQKSLQDEGAKVTFCGTLPGPTPLPGCLSFQAHFPMHLLFLETFSNRALSHSLHLRV